MDYIKTNLVKKTSNWSLGAMSIHNCSEMISVMPYVDHRRLPHICAYIKTTLEPISVSFEIGVKTT